MFAAAAELTELIQQKLERAPAVLGAEHEQHRRLDLVHMGDGRHGPEAVQVLRRRPRCHALLALLYRVARIRVARISMQYKAL